MENRVKKYRIVTSGEEGVENCHFVVVSRGRVGGGSPYVSITYFSKTCQKDLQVYSFQS